MNEIKINTASIDHAIESLQNERNRLQPLRHIPHGVKAGSQIYLTADEIQIIKKALDAYFDHCGEVIADYKESETLEMPHTDFETENYNEAFHVRDVIRLSLTRKLK